MGHDRLIIGASWEGDRVLRVSCMDLWAGGHPGGKALFMARQTGPIKMTGTVEGITFYRIGDAYYARARSSLTAKKVRTHPRFALTRKYAEWLGMASRMASEVYRSLPEEERKYELFCALKKLAHQRVKEGADREVILPELKDHAGQIRLEHTVIQPFACAGASLAHLAVRTSKRKERRGPQRSAKKNCKRRLSLFKLSAFYPSSSSLSPLPLINTKCLLVKEKGGYYIYARPRAYKKPRPLFYEKPHAASGGLPPPV